MFTPYAWSKRMDDRQISIAADGHHSIGADKNRNCLREAHNSTHYRTKGPIKQQESWYRRERYTKERNQDVSNCHISDEEVGYRPLTDVCENNRTYNCIAHTCHNKYDWIENIDNSLKQGRWDERIVVSNEFITTWVTVPLRSVQHSIQIEYYRLISHIWPNNTWPLLIQILLYEFISRSQ